MTSGFAHPYSDLPVVPILEHSAFGGVAFWWEFTFTASHFLNNAPSSCGSFETLRLQWVWGKDWVSVDWVEGAKCEPGVCGGPSLWSVLAVVAIQTEPPLGIPSCLRAKMKKGGINGWHVTVASRANWLCAPSQPITYLRRISTRAFSILPGILCSSQFCSLYTELPLLVELSSVWPPEDKTEFGPKHTWLGC